MTDRARFGASVRRESEGLCVPVDRGAPSRAEPPVDVKTLHAKIGELALENDFLERALGKAGLLSAKR